MAGRPATVVDNRVLVEYLSQFDHTNPIPDWLDNVLYGAANIGTYNPSSHMAILSALKQLPFLTAKSAERFVNRKREVMGMSLFKERYVFMFFSRLRFAHNGILFHYEKRTGQDLITAYNSKELFDGNYPEQG